MKNNNILRLRLLLTITTILAISFNSCQKEESLPLDTQQEEQNETFVLVQKAKDWFDLKSLQVASESNIDLNLNDYKPDWNAFAIDTNSTGDRVINISLVKDKKSQSDSAFYTQMSIVLNKANVASGVIKEYVDNPYQGESEIRLYTGNGKLLAKGVYQSRTGKMKLKTTFAKSFKAVSSGGNPNGGKLMWEAEVGENVNGSGIWLDEVVITDTYEPPPAWEPETPYDPPVDPGIPVDPGPIGGSGGGGSTGANTVTSSDIHNDLSNECLKNLLNELLNKNIKTRVISILQEFQANKTIEFDYVDGAGLSSDFYGYFNPNASTESRYQIELNPNLLPYASKELATVVILHESIHAYFYMNGKIEELHHGDMAIRYTGLLAQALVDIYGTPRDIANKLSWLGLMGTQAWELHKNSLSQTEINDIANTINSNKNGSSGTKYCN